MGKEAFEVVGRFADGEDEGRLQWEAPKLVFRPDGKLKRTFEGEALIGLKAEGDDLLLADGTRFTLGAVQASRWATAILTPPGRLDKLGVKPDLRVAVLNLGDPDFVTELSSRGVPADDLSELDLLFYGADSEAELARIGELVPTLAARGALWIVSLKGKLLKVKDVEVMAAARAAGLVDSKVCSFSETRTALRFTRRKGG